MTENKKRGRPKKMTIKGTMLSARFTTDEADEIARAVAKSGEPKTAWMQKILLSAAREIIRKT